MARKTNCWEADIKVYDVSGFTCSLTELPKSEIAKILKAIAKGHEFGVLDIPDEYWYGTPAPEGLTKQDHIKIMEEERTILERSALDNFKLKDYFDHLKIENVEEPLPELPEPMDDEEEDEEDDEEDENEDTYRKD